MRVRQKEEEVRKRRPASGGAPSIGGGGLDGGAEVLEKYPCNLLNNPLIGIAIRIFTENPYYLPLSMVPFRGLLVRIASLKGVPCIC